MDLADQDLADMVLTIVEGDPRLKQTIESVVFMTAGSMGGGLVATLVSPPTVALSVIAVAVFVFMLGGMELTRTLRIIMVQ